MGRLLVVGDAVKIRPFYSGSYRISMYDYRNKVFTVVRILGCGTVQLNTKQTLKDPLVKSMFKQDELRLVEMENV